jgi:nucleotide-binding universal stress UspA family protein
MTMPPTSRPILLALDFSTKDDRGVAVAAAVAELSGATPHIVLVLAEKHGKIDTTGTMLGDETAARHALEAIAERLSRDVGRPATSEVLFGDDVAAALTRCATERDALLVILSTRAPGAVGRAIRGSIADRMMRECPIPVLLVPPGTDYMAGKRVHLSRVLVPLDGSALALRALDYMLALPHATHLEYSLLEVVKHDSERSAAEARLQAAAQRVRAAGAKAVEFNVVVTSHPAGAIVEAIREVFVEAIAMSSRGAGGIRRLVLGSVAEGVVRASEVPVLLLTPASLTES